MTVLNESRVDSFLIQAAKNIGAAPELQTFSSLFSWAGHPVRIVLAGIENIRFFTDAISHRLIDENSTDQELTICVVDDSIAGSVLPDPFWKSGDFDGYGRFLVAEEQYFVEYSSNNEILTILSRSSGICMIWIRDVTKLPEWERSFPFRTVLYQWFKDRHFLFVHAGAVGNDNGGVLLTGKGGTGKSTTTLACLDSGLKYAGDDFVMIDTKTLEVHSLYNVAKLEASNLHRFPELAPYIANPESLPQDKGQLFLHFFRPESLIPGFKLRAIFLPKYTGRDNTTIRPATRGDALLALAPSTIGLLNADIQMMTSIAGLIQRLPCYWIETGINLNEIPIVISNWLKEETNV